MILTAGSTWNKSIAVSCLAHLTAIILIGMVSFEAAEQPVKQESLIQLEVSEAVEQTNTGTSGVMTAANHKNSQPAVGKSVAVSQSAKAGGQAVSSTAEAYSSGDFAVNGSAGGSFTGEAAGIASAGGEYSSDGDDAEPASEAGGSGAGAVDIGAIGNAFAAEVERCKEYPYMAMRRGQSGVVSVWVQLAADGSLAGVEITGSSGVKSLDESAVKAVRQACPFSHNAGRTIELVVPIYYELRG